MLGVLPTDVSIHSNVAPFKREMLTLKSRSGVRGNERRSGDGDDDD